MALAQFYLVSSVTRSLPELPPYTTADVPDDTEWVGVHLTARGERGPQRGDRQGARRGREGRPGADQVLPARGLTLADVQERWDVRRGGEG